jgi:hypothetical protein
MPGKPNQVAQCACRQRRIALVRHEMALGLKIGLIHGAGIANCSAASPGSVRGAKGVVPASWVALRATQDEPTIFSFKFCRSKFFCRGTKVVVVVLSRTCTRTGHFALGKTRPFFPKSIAIARVHRPKDTAGSNLLRSASQSYQQRKSAAFSGKSCESARNFAISFSETDREN